MQVPAALVTQASVRNCYGQAATQQAEQASSEQREAEADTPASCQQAGSELQSLQPRGARDTGIQLAAADKKGKEAPTDAAWDKDVTWRSTHRSEERYPGDRWVAAALAVHLPPMWLFPESRQAERARPFGWEATSRRASRLSLVALGSAVCLWHVQRGLPSSFVTMWSASGS